MNSVGDAFAFPFRDPAWVSKIALQGLIAIIPVVGWIAGAGWLMMTYDNLRAGRQELAPAGFHLERGIALFGVVFIYGLVINIPASALDAASRSTTSRGNISILTPTSDFGSLLGLAAQLLLDFLMPALIVLTARSGFTGGLDVARVWELATRQINNSITATLVIFAADIVGLLGIVACCVGVFFTLTYAAAVQAGVAAWFEKMDAAPAAPPGTSSS